MGFSQQSAMVICCDGTPETAAASPVCSGTDPATGVMRHAEAGYGIAHDCAREHGLRLRAIFGELKRRSADRLAVGKPDLGPCATPRAHCVERAYPIDT